MKRFLVVGCMLSCFCLVGCGKKETGVVVDKDEAAQYNIPEGVMEAEMKKAADASAKKSGN